MTETIGRVCRECGQVYAVKLIRQTGDELEQAKRQLLAGPSLCQTCLCHRREFCFSRFSAYVSLLCQLPAISGVPAYVKQAEKLRNAAIVRHHTVFLSYIRGEELSPADMELLQSFREVSDAEEIIRIT